MINEKAFLAQPYFWIEVYHYVDLRNHSNFKQNRSNIQQTRSTQHALDRWFYVSKKGEKFLAGYISHTKASLCNPRIINTSGKKTTWGILSVIMMIYILINPPNLLLTRHKNFHNFLHCIPLYNLFSQNIKSNYIFSTSREELT